MSWRAHEAPFHCLRKPLNLKPSELISPLLCQPRTIQCRSSHTSQSPPLEQLGTSTDASLPSAYGSVPEPVLVKKILVNPLGYRTSREQALEAHAQHVRSSPRLLGSDLSSYSSATAGEAKLVTKSRSSSQGSIVRRLGEATNPKYTPYGAKHRQSTAQRQPHEDLWSISVPEELHLDDSEPDTHQRKSTLTELERSAFAQLFKSLVEKTGEDHGVGGYEKFEREIEEEDDDTSYADLDMILDKDMAYQPPLIQRYPNVLQGMAARTELEMAQSTRRKSKEEVYEVKTGGENDPVNIARRQEMRRIETRFLTAITDVDLWIAIEDELFSKIRKLHLDGKAAAAADTDTYPDQTQSQRKRKQAPPKEKAETAAATTASKVTSPKAIPCEDNSFQSLATFGTAYPALLLLALRLLCRRTVLTPFALAVLPALKSIGLSSYVLGASTALYNELLSYRWRVFCDLGGMLSLLREMSTAGLSMDTRTFAILQNVVAYRHSALRGDYGEGNRCVELMMVRQSEGKEIKMWRQKVKAEVEEQALERLRRVETEQRVREEGAFAEDDNTAGG